MAELAALNVKITGDASGIKAAANSASASVEKFTKSAESSAKVFERAFAQNERSVDRLRRAIDPVYASSKKYESAVNTLDKALKQGNITQAAHAKLIEQANAAYLRAGAIAAKTGTSMTGLGGIMGRLDWRAKQAAMNFGDLIIQLQGGQRWSTAFAQQGAQMAGVLGPVGAAVGTLAAVSLPLLAAAFFNSSDEGQKFEDALRDIQAAADDVDAALNLLKLSTDELVEKYGFAAQRVREFALAQAELVAAQSARRLADQVSILRDEIEQYTVTARAAATNLTAMTAEEDAINRVMKDFGVGRDAARELSGHLADINRAATFEEQQAALEAVLTLLRAHNIALSEIPTELQRAISEIITYSNETDRARYLTEQLAAAARQVTIGVPLYEQDLSGGLAPPSSTGSSTTRSGGGRRTNPIEAQLESLRQSLLTAEEAQIASYQRQQETLAAALEQRLITQQEYQALMEDAQRQHADRMAGIDAFRYGDSLQRTEAFLGGMAAALQGGNEKMAKIGEKFAAAEALVNAWRAYSQTLADPRLPFWQKVPAALSILGAGMKAVKAIGGSGGGSGGAAAAPAAASGGAAAAGNSTYYSVSLTGGNNYGGEQIRGLISQINQAIEDGAVIRGIRVA